LSSFQIPPPISAPENEEVAVVVQFQFSVAQIFVEVDSKEGTIRAFDDQTPIPVDVGEIASIIDGIAVRRLDQSDAEGCGGGGVLIAD